MIQITVISHPNCAGGLIPVAPSLGEAMAGSIQGTD